MKHSQSRVLYAVVALVFVFGSRATAQNSNSPPTPQRRVLHLNGANSGHYLAARVNQPVEITLQTIGPGYYGTPEISSSAVRFESAASPKLKIPAGPTQVNRFRAASEGEALIRIAHVLKLAHGKIKDLNPAFAITIRVTGR